MSTPKEIADLSMKCSNDVIKTIKLTTQLGDDFTEKMFIATGAVTGAAAAVACYMGPALLDKNDAFAQSLSDGALFAMIMSWLIKDPTTRHHPPSIDDLVRQSVAGWEAITGRSFDASWLHPNLKECLQQENVNG